MTNLPTTEAIRQSFLPGPDGQASGAIQVELSARLDRLRELIDQLSTDKKLASAAKQVEVLVDEWYSMEPWYVSQEKAREQLISMNVAIFFMEHLTPATPTLNLPKGLSLQDAIKDFEVTAPILQVATRYIIRQDSMGPQLMPGTKVLAIKTDPDEWAHLIGKVVLITHADYLKEEILGRIVKITRLSVYLRPDNKKHLKLTIPRRSILALYFVNYIIGQVVP